MRQGTIKIRSGSWAWTIEESGAGALVKLTDRHRQLDEMHAWVEDLEDAERAVKDAVRDPAFRMWTDADGSSWRLYLRPVRTREELYRLVLSRGTYTREVFVPTDFSLGEQTHQELADLLKKSVQI